MDLMMNPDLIGQRHRELLNLVDELSEEGFFVSKVEMVDRDGHPALTLEMEWRATQKVVSDNDRT